MTGSLLHTRGQPLCWGPACRDSTVAANFCLQSSKCVNLGESLKSPGFNLLVYERANKTPLRISPGSIDRRRCILLLALETVHVPKQKAQAEKVRGLLTRTCQQGAEHKEVFGLKFPGMRVSSGIHGPKQDQLGAEVPGPLESLLQRQFLNYKTSDCRKTVSS